jgi:hypothetical protein
MKVLDNVSTLAAAAIVTSMAALPIAAHHSTAAFDNARVVKLEGTITQFRWINPHASIKIDATSEGDDADGIWTVEMTAPNVLINEGWTRTALQEGDKVTMYVNPLRNQVVLNDGSTGGLYVGVVLKDGKKLGRTDGQGAGSSR